MRHAIVITGIGTSWSLVPRHRDHPFHAIVIAGIGIVIAGIGAS
jgi:hypothetical protein